MKNYAQIDQIHTAFSNVVRQRVCWLEPLGADVFGDGEIDALCESHGCRSVDLNCPRASRSTSASLRVFGPRTPLPMATCMPMPAHRHCSTRSK